MKRIKKRRKDHHMRKEKIYRLERGKWSDKERQVRKGKAEIMHQKVKEYELTTREKDF